MKKEIKSRWYVEIFDGNYDVAFKRIYIPCVDVNLDYGKCLKKLWKRICKMNRYMDNIFVFAYIESEDGELHDISSYWVNEELECI